MISPSEKVKILLDKAHQRPTTSFQDHTLDFLRLPIYTQDDSTISGTVNIDLGSQKVKHSGIFIQLVGVTENYHKDDEAEEFLYLSKELEVSGKLQGPMDYPFSFKNFELKYETYYGLAGRIRYYLRALIKRENKSSIKTELEFAVQLPLAGLFFQQGFEIQLRIADYLMINVGLNKTHFHTGECVIGKISMEKVHLIIKKIQVSLVKREITNPTFDITCTHEEILKKIEVSNKCPKKGDLFPFKINLSSLDISPCILESNTKYVVKYMLILSFIDGEDRSLFKPVELNIWRQK